MISKEPLIAVGISDHCREVSGAFSGIFESREAGRLQGTFKVRAENGKILVSVEGKSFTANKEAILKNVSAGTFTLQDVVIGAQFHWEQKEKQTFRGGLKIVVREDGTLAVINEIPLEEYLASVISSEMNPEAPGELLKAHAIISRSWLGAMLARKEHGGAGKIPQAPSQGGEISRWYSREDHDLFDVCADDHCQRYRGITKISSHPPLDAVQETKGVFLFHADEICDARFSKACGGLTEEFENTWEDKHVPYLESVSDSSVQHPKLQGEAAAEDWILSNPDAYCNTIDDALLKQILPSSDLATKNFFRWAVDYDRRELEEIIESKSGIDFGTLLDIVPIQRGPSGRIFRLKIVGSNATIIVGKELEIRRWLSTTHLYSSAFVVMTEREEDGTPKHFLLYGAGWGHGVGLCQIGAAVMAAKNFSAEAILQHYFHDTRLQKLY